MGLRPTEGDENGLDRDTISATGNGRGRDRSGEVEAVRESDPDRAFEQISVRCLSDEEGR